MAKTEETKEPLVPDEEVVEPVPEDEPEGLTDAEKILAKEKELEKAKQTVAVEEAARSDAERELRRYVRRGGGYRKKIPKKDKVRAQMLMNRLGRKKPAWDESIVLYDLHDNTGVVKGG